MRDFRLWETRRELWCAYLRGSLASGVWFHTLERRQDENPVAATVGVGVELVAAAEQDIFRRNVDA